MKFELKDGTPLAVQVSYWTWDSYPCDKVGDLGRIRLGTGQLIYVELCKGRDNRLWLVRREPPATMAVRQNGSDITSRLIPAIYLLQRIANIDTGELASGDRPDDLRGFKKFQSHALAAAKQLREVVDLV